MMTESHLLKTFKLLEGRLYFDESMYKTYQRLSRGFEGERVFFQQLEDEGCSHLCIFDYSFAYDGNEAQIDVLILTELAVYHLEIKHYSGAYTMAEGHWRLSDGRKIQNPLLQLSRAHDLLAILLQAKRMNLPIHSYLVFTHPKFQLFNAAADLPIIYPNQISGFIWRINQEPPLQNQYWKTKLSENRIKQSKYEVMPEYDYDEIRKGLFCAECRGRLIRINRKSLTCKQCRKNVTTHLAFEQALKEFCFLFPQLSVTNARMIDWIDGELSRNNVRLNLKKHLSLISKARASYYQKE